MLWVFACGLLINVAVPQGSWVMGSALLISAHKSKLTLSANTLYWPHATQTVCMSFLYSHMCMYAWKSVKVGQSKSEYVYENE